MALIKVFLILFLILIFHMPNNFTEAGPVTYGICQAGCATLVVACYAGAGFTFGTVTASVGTPAAVLACNVAFGKCQAACWAALVSLTP